jgi:hypothetical protein
MMTIIETQEQTKEDYIFLRKYFNPTKHAFCTLKEFMSFKDVIVIRIYNIKKANELVGLTVCTYIPGNKKLHINWICVKKKYRGKTPRTLKNTDYYISGISDNLYAESLRKESKDWHCSMVLLRCIESIVISLKCFKVSLYVRFSNLPALVRYLNSGYKTKELIIYEDGTPGYYMEKDIKV